MFAFLLKESSDIKNYLETSSPFQFFPVERENKTFDLFSRSGDLRRIRHSDEWVFCARETMLMNSLLYYQSIRFDECFISCLKRD